MRITKLKISAFFLLIMQAMIGQDYHLSHYDVASLYLNPASTGMYGRDLGDYKIYADQRSQWRSVGVKPFLTSFIGYDQPLQIKERNFGAGCFLVNNNGGIGSYNTFSFMGSMAYDILGGKTKSSSAGISTKDHLLSVGLQLGFFYRSTNPNALNYDVQYSVANNGGSFDQSLPSNEIYNRVNITRFDANYGIYYKYMKRGKKAYPFAGFSMNHLSRPNESFTDAEARMPIRFVGYAGADVKLNEKFLIAPRFLFMNQAKASEFTPGFLLYYHVNDKDINIVFGGDYRWKDAVIVSLGLKNEYYAFRFSYDFNTSYLKNYTNGRGAYELSIIYAGQRSASKAAGPTRY
jgi:type IX secretion system PorP/SprF family membrane protein